MHNRHKINPQPVCRPELWAAAVTGTCVTVAAVAAIARRHGRETRERIDSLAAYQHERERNAPETYSALN